MLHHHVSTVAQNGQTALERAHSEEICLRLWLRIVGRRGCMLWLWLWLLPISYTFLVPWLCRSIIMSKDVYVVLQTLWRYSTTSCC